MKLIKYIITFDTGLAPNPFGKYCTLALCTPNHINALLEKNDWILGHSSKETGNKLIYLMKITEDIIGKEKYFKDSRFQYKKPRISRDRRNIVGDNIYNYEKGTWIWKGIKGFHGENSEQTKDVKYNKVFISNYFFYFGDKSIKIDNDFIWDRQGCKYVREQPKIKKFIKKIENVYTPGLIGMPRDLPLKNVTKIKC